MVDVTEQLLPQCGGGTAPDMGGVAGHIAALKMQDRKTADHVRTGMLCLTHCVL